MEKKILTICKILLYIFFFHYTVCQKYIICRKTPSEKIYRKELMKKILEQIKPNPKLYNKYINDLFEINEEKKTLLKQLKEAKLALIVFKENKKIEKKFNRKTNILLHFYKLNKRKKKAFLNLIHQTIKTLNKNEKNHLKNLIKLDNSLAFIINRNKYTYPTLNIKNINDIFISMMNYTKITFPCIFSNHFIIKFIFKKVYQKNQNHFIFNEIYLPKKLFKE